MSHSSCFRLFLLSLALLIAGFVSPALTQPAKGKKVALLVGVAEYDSAKFPTLKYPENDVNELAKILKGKAGTFDEVLVLTNSAGAKDKSKAPTAANIRKALDAITAGRKKNDTVLIALAGHGLQLEVHDPDDDKAQSKTYSFFCPVDADLRGVSYSTGKSRTLLQVKEVLAALDECGAGTRLVLMDACRNELKAESATRSLDVRKFTIPDGVAALFSCKAGQKAFETKALQHGVFFHFVLEGLRGKAANSRNEVTWDLLVNYVKEEVSERVPTLVGDGARQEPQSVGSLSGKSPVLTRVGGKSLVNKVPKKGAKGRENVVAIETNHGTIKVELYPDKAPITVKNFLAYVDDKFYDGLVFHRVIESFMIQGGGFTKGAAAAQNLTALEKKTKEAIKCESDNGLPNTRGTIAMARTAVADSATAQFFINVKDNEFLDKAKATDKVGYCVFGKVIEGMAVVDKIKQVKTKKVGDFDNVPTVDVVIESISRE